MPRRIDLGRAVLVGGALLLLISLFTRWYDTGATGWEVFETLDLVLAAIAVGAVAAATRPDAAPPWAGWALPAAALVIVLVQLVNVPPAATGGSPSTGAWLALAASFLMAAGSALSLTAISVTVHVSDREVRRRVPAVDRRGQRDAAAAEDLDADVDSEPFPPTGTQTTTTPAFDTPTPPGAPSGKVAASEEALATRDGRSGESAGSGPAAAGDDASPARGGRVEAHEAPASRSSADDLERTQPLAGLPDDASQDADRP